MSDDEILELAKSAVDDHLRPLARIAVRHDAPVGLLPARLGVAPDEKLAELIARRVGASLQPPQPDSADVEFVEQTPLGKRTTVVHVRNGKVARILKTG